MLRRFGHEDRVMWVANLNGVTLQYVSEDKACILHEEGIADGKCVGVRLVDEDGNQVAFAVERLTH